MSHSPRVISDDPTRTLFLLPIRNGRFANRPDWRTESPYLLSRKPLALDLTDSCRFPCRNPYSRRSRFREGGRSPAGTRLRVPQHPFPPSRAWLPCRGTARGSTVRPEGPRGPAQRAFQRLAARSPSGTPRRARRGSRIDRIRSDVPGAYPPIPGPGYRRRGRWRCSAPRAGVVPYGHRRRRFGRRFGGPQLHLGTGRAVGQHDRVRAHLFEPPSVKGFPAAQPRKAGLAGLAQIGGRLTVRDHDGGQRMAKHGRGLRNRSWGDVRRFRSLGWLGRLRRLADGRDRGRTPIAPEQRAGRGLIHCGQGTEGWIGQSGRIQDPRRRRCSRSDLTIAIGVSLQLERYQGDQPGHDEQQPGGDGAHHAASLEPAIQPDIRS